MIVLPALLVRALGLSSTSFFMTLAVGWGIASMLYVGKWGTFALQAWKLRYVNPRFMIATLRPFHDDSTSYLFRHLVAPALGCYGDVAVVTDSTYTGAEQKVDDRLVDFQYLGDARLAMKVSDEEWRKKVPALIAAADLAVIDMTLPSLNLLWETAVCVQFLPPHRILLIGVKGIPWQRTRKLVSEYLAECLPAGTGAVDLAAISYGDYLFGTWRFRLRLFRKMRAIARLDGALAASGTWHPRKAPTGHGRERWLDPEIM